MPFDELNVLEAKIEALKDQDPEQLKKYKADYIDEITDFFVLSYVYGTNDAGKQLDQEIMPDLADLQEALSKRFDGKDYKERLSDYFESGTTYDINRVLETDMHRIYNTGLWDGARRAGATHKTWNCMMLPTSRDTHIYLDSTKIPIDAEFYSFKGGKTMYPGEWGIAEEDCNCMCWVTFSKEG